MKPAHHLSALRCPLCAEPLHRQERTARCANNHAFDLAKEGYLNLLLSHQRKSKTPGDDKAMIQARRRFFDSGVYDLLPRFFQQATADLPQPTLLDCGCGEGRMVGELSEKKEGSFFGIDISKEAIRCAAKRYKKATWIVTNGMREIPFADQSMDCILSVLAPRNIEEFARILKPTGQLILGVPGPNHLIELRSQLTLSASDFEEKANEAVAKSAPQFVENRRDLLSEDVLLNRAQIADLIQMTPIFWNSSPEAKATVQRLEQLPLTVSFTLLTLGTNRFYKKKGI